LGVTALKRMTLFPDVPTLEESGYCHFHIFDPRHPAAPDRPVRSAATADDYQAYRHALGLSRGVVIAPSSYGYDNACLFDAMERFGTADFRAVAIPPPDFEAIDWLGWHVRGVRGLRLYTGHSDFPKPHALWQLAAKAADHGWHLQFVGEQAREPFPDLVHVLADVPCLLVFDHFAFAPQPDAASSLTAKAMYRLLDGGRTYVKLSGMYIQSRRLANDYDDFNQLAQDLVRQAPDRLLWGSDWPLAEAKPDGRKLLAQLEVWAPQPEWRTRILVDNPTALYWAS
jgi:predicted TIM-barrel fold metal-dependent hydrolase